MTSEERVEVGRTLAFAREMHEKYRDKLARHQHDKSRFAVFCTPLWRRSLANYEKLIGRCERVLSGQEAL